MKTSTSITIAFLVFFFGTFTALHIDSKLYEPEYKEKKAMQKEFFKVIQKEKLDVKVWDEYIAKVKKYATMENIYPREIANSATIILSNYQKFNDLEALSLAEKWCKRAHDAEPKNHKINNIYAIILFNLGEKEEAIRILKLALKYSEGRRDNYYFNQYQKQLDLFEKALNEKSNKE